MAEAERLKNEANDYFKDGKYELALERYSSAIALDPNVAVYYGNRSLCYLKMECYGYALQDATSSIQLDSNYIKGYYRRASANMALGKFKLALNDYDAVTRACPNNTDAQRKFSECKKIVHQQNFAKAIEVSDRKSAADALNLDAMTIENDYDGPILEEKGVTLEFMNKLLPYLKSQKKLHRKFAFKMLIEFKKYLEKQPSLVEIVIPEGGKLTVCGDVHGQFYDLLNIFAINGLPSETNPYLFNGDFVDRGSFSVEVIFTLIGFKLLYPNAFFMSRGNHETSSMNQMYGFEGEVKSKYSQNMVDIFTEVYNLLPLCHLINNRVLAMHGGLPSEDGITLDHIRSVDRNRQPPESGLMCDLLWADPQTQPGRSASKRGVSMQFGPDITADFCSRNNLDYIIRSHEVKPEGYEIAHDRKCVTVFSAPNYCDQMGNLGAFITLTSNLKPQITTFAAVSHPDVKAMAFSSNYLSLFGLS